MDLQGAELHALRGGVKFLEGVDAVATEINFDELYVGCVRAPELDEFMQLHGFRRVETEMAQNNVGWGDALYLRVGL
jgi:hypothetical protein